MAGMTIPWAPFSVASGPPMATCACIAWRLRQPCSRRWRCRDWGNMWCKMMVWWAHGSSSCWKRLKMHGSHRLQVFWSDSCSAKESVHWRPLLGEKPAAILTKGWPLECRSVSPWCCSTQPAFNPSSQSHGPRFGPFSWWARMVRPCQGLRASYP